MLRCGFHVPLLLLERYLQLSALVQGDKLTLKVNKLSSTKTQLPYDYYSIPYCRPEAIVSSAENLGEVLRGDRIENSLYEVRVPASSSNRISAALRCSFCMTVWLLPPDRDQSGPAMQGIVQNGFSAVQSTGRCICLQN